MGLITFYLKKPLSYFFPPYLYQEIKQEDLTPLENELLIQFRRIVDNTLKEVVIKQVKAIGEFDPREMVIDLAPVIAENLEWEGEMIEFLRNRSIKRK